HSDGTGNEYANVVLSARRAQAAKVALVARGIPADRMVISAYGVSQPIDGSDPKAPANRRVVITWRLL
ncbi:MAG: OmpA family protein, partial [Janthinobacterium lividum]